MSVPSFTEMGLLVSTVVTRVHSFCANFTSARKQLKFMDLTFDMVAVATTTTTVIYEFSIDRMLPSGNREELYPYFVEFSPFPVLPDGPLFELCVMFQPGSSQHLYCRYF